MLIQNCSKGQRVICKENGKPATILSVSHNKGEIVIAFDNAERRTVQASVLEPAPEQVPAERATGGPMRPCPNCATKMPVDVRVCPKCGFQYGVKKRGGGGKFAKALIALIVLAAIAYAAWKFVLNK